jgi:hypothetical protein
MAHTQTVSHLSWCSDSMAGEGGGREKCACHITPRTVAGGSMSLEFSIGTWVLLCNMAKQDAPWVSIWNS